MWIIRAWLCVVVVLLISAVAASGQIVYPLTLRVLWSPNPAVEKITGYIVTVDGVASNVLPATCTAETCETSFVIASAGPHTVSVAAMNDWGTGESTAVTFTVIQPGKSENIQIRK